MPDDADRTLSDQLWEAADALDRGMTCFRDGTKLRRAAKIVEAADRLRELPHFVTFQEAGWELEHDLRCRVEGMLDCPIHAELQDWGKPEPDEMGRFEVRIEDGDLTFVRASVADPAKDLLDALEEATRE